MLTDIVQRSSLISSLRTRSARRSVICFATAQLSRTTCLLQYRTQYRIFFASCGTSTRTSLHLTGLANVRLLEMLPLSRTHSQLPSVQDCSKEEIRKSLRTRLLGFTKGRVVPKMLLMNQFSTTQRIDKQSVARFRAQQTRTVGINASRRALTIRLQRSLNCPFAPSI